MRPPPASGSAGAPPDAAIGEGFADPKAASRDLLALERALGGRWAQAIRRHSAEGANPDAVLSSFERVKAALRNLDPGRAAKPLSRLFAASQFFPSIIAARPALLRWAFGSPYLDREKSAAQFAAEATAAVRRAPLGDEGRLHRALRRYKYRELLRIALKDAALFAAMPEIGRETSALAEAVVGAALAWLERWLSSRYGAPSVPGFCALGMGKLGGEDLNFSSDIDLVYLYRSGGETLGGSAGALDQGQYFSKLAAALTRAISEKTQDGFCFRVDLNLRPQGRGGAIVLSLPAAVAYYESFGRTWERAALIKARGIAGDAELAAEFLQAVSPFVWRRSADLSAVDDLKELKAQIDLRGKGSLEDVKLGPGGIREVEFFANALQLLHGGRQPALRERNTVRALRKLQLSGLLSAQDTDALEGAYWFLRRVENRLQMLQERQTQALPAAGPERERLARSLGFAGAPAFDADLAAHREDVKSAFGVLLGQTAKGEVPDEPLLAVALDPGASPEDRTRALSSRGFQEPERALSHLERLARLPGGPFASPGLAGIRLLAEIARTADPDQALLHLYRFIGQLWAPQGYWDLLANLPQASRRLLNVFGQSDSLSQYFLGHPQLLDSLVQGLEEEPYKQPDRLRVEFTERVQRAADLEEQLAAMRRVRNEEVLRIGMHDIAGNASAAQVAEQLTALAEAALAQCLRLAESEQVERYGSPLDGGRPQTLSVIGMGTLGGRELGYLSDLDLLFVYSGEGMSETSGGTRGRVSHHEYFAKWVQRLTSYLQLRLGEGYLYQIDSRLRPSGNQGALVVNQRAFLDHHLRSQLWERQALIKARGVAGDAGLFERIRAEVIEPLVYRRPLPPGSAAEIDRLRSRMERELARETADQLNPKTGRGGLVDVEFAVQYLQLVHGPRHPEVRTPNTLEAIAALEAVGALPTPEAQALRAGYLFLRRVENRVRLVHGHSLSHIPSRGRALALLARRLGYLGTDPGESFLGEYRACTARVRAVYARLLRGERP